MNKEIQKKANAKAKSVLVKYYESHCIYEYDELLAANEMDKAWEAYLTVRYYTEALIKKGGIQIPRHIQAEAVVAAQNANQVGYDPNDWYSYYYEDANQYWSSKAYWDVIAQYCDRVMERRS